MSKESRVNHLESDLRRLEFANALNALRWMIAEMRSDKGYKRRDGSHYYYHLVDSTQDLINHGVHDEDTITACILHDAVEDIEHLRIADIEERFGLNVAVIVEKVTKRADLDYKDPKNIVKYLNNILLDPKACLVKTADRKHNFSTLGHMDRKHEIRKVEETEMFFLPFFKEARAMHPEYSAYFHSAKTTIMPHLLRIKKAIEDEEKLKKKNRVLELKLEQSRLREKALRKAIKGDSK